MSAILLVDNGSRRAGSTLLLRRLASALGKRIGRLVEPVSLQHADRAPIDALGGRQAVLLEQRLTSGLSANQRDFLLVPLFFGPSRAISGAIPEMAERLCERFGAFRLRVAETLCPPGEGETMLAQVMEESLEPGAGEIVVLVDHGSPIPQVTAVRSRLAQALSERLGDRNRIVEAVMERRPGPEYDFNGPLLADAIDRIAQDTPEARIALSLLFLAPGRHAGEGGDIAEIVAAARRRHPGLRIRTSRLVGEHPLLPEILAERIHQAELQATTETAA